MMPFKGGPLLVSVHKGWVWLEFLVGLIYTPGRVVHVLGAWESKPFASIRGVVGERPFVKRAFTLTVQRR